MVTFWCWLYNTGCTKCHWIYLQVVGFLLCKFRFHWKTIKRCRTFRSEFSGLQTPTLSRGPPFPHQSIRGRIWPERRVQAAFSSGEGERPTSTGEQRITWSPGGCQIPSINAWTTGAGGFFYYNCRDEGGRQVGDAWGSGSLAPSSCRSKMSSLFLPFCWLSALLLFLLVKYQDFIFLWNMFPPPHFGRTQDNQWRPSLYR